MSLPGQSQRVPITAAASGIGRAIAEALLEEGAKVHICDISADNLALCQTELDSPNLSHTQIDIADPAQVELLFQDIQSH